MQGGEAAGSQVPRRIRGPEATDGGAFAETLQEATQGRPTHHHVRHVPDGGGEVCREQREVGRLTPRLPGLPQRYGCLGHDARKPTAADQRRTLADDVQAEESEGRGGDKGEGETRCTFWNHEELFALIIAFYIL